MRGLIAAFLTASCLHAAAQDVRTFIPPQAPTVLPVLRQVQEEHWPDLIMPEVLAGQAEKESCIHLRHPRCWNPSSRLKSAREEGAGIPQITRAYHTSGPNTGKLRFDALAEMRARHPALRPLNWDNVYERLDLQLLVLVLKNRDNWFSFEGVRSQTNRLVFTLLAYNRGTAGVLREMTACKLKEGCDPQVFFGHVEKTCTASWKPIYGNNSPCSISRAYPGDILYTRSPKYRPFFR